MEEELAEVELGGGAATGAMVADELARWGGEGRDEHKNGWFARAATRSPWRRDRHRSCRGRIELKCMRDQPGGGGGGCCMLL